MPEIDFKNIDLLVLDVDGVMTDGKVILTPAGEEIKMFHVRDGSGMKIWKRMGKKMAIISGRGSKAIEIRAKDLDVDALRLNAIDKLPAYRQVLSELNVSPQRTAVVGDDLPDLPLMRNCAFSVAVADAVEEVRSAATYITIANGGCGAVREVIELILRKSGQWDKVMERYRRDDRESRP